MKNSKEKQQTDSLDLSETRSSSFTLFISKMIHVQKPETWRMRLVKEKPPNKCGVDRALYFKKSDGNDFSDYLLSSLKDSTYNVCLRTLVFNYVPEPGWERLHLEEFIHFLGHQQRENLISCQHSWQAKLWKFPQFQGGDTDALGDWLDQKRPIEHFWLMNTTLFKREEK